MTDCVLCTPPAVVTEEYLTALEAHLDEEERLARSLPMGFDASSIAESHIDAITWSVDPAHATARIETMRRLIAEIRRCWS